jgi:hypothetical protein
VVGGDGGDGVPARRPGGRPAASAGPPGDRAGGTVRRRVAPVVAAVPAAACLLAALGWARSYWVRDALTRTAFAQGDGQPMLKRVDEWASGRGAVAWYTDTEVWTPGTPAAARGRGNASQIARSVPAWEWERQRDPAADANLSVPPRAGHFRWATAASLVRADGEQVTERTVTLPWWEVVAAATPVPAVQAVVYARRRRARQRRERGLCPACGYDLRASPGRCPEMFSLLQLVISYFFAACCPPRDRAGVQVRAGAGESNRITQEPWAVWFRACSASS